MANLPLGSIITKFNNTFILTDPQLTKGLELWRQVLLPPVADNLSGLAGVLPIVVQNLSLADAVNVSFDINNLPAVGEATSLLTPLTRANAMLQNGKGASPVVKGVKSINAILPVNKVEQEGLFVLFFDIKALPLAEITEPADRKYNVAVKPYNGRSGIEITSDLPMVDEVSGDTATFSFDITDLNYV